MPWENVLTARSPLGEWRGAQSGEGHASRDGRRAKRAKVHQPAFLMGVSGSRLELGGSSVDSLVELTLGLAGVRTRSWCAHESISIRSLMVPSLDVGISAFASRKERLICTAMPSRMSTIPRDALSGPEASTARQPWQPTDRFASLFCRLGCVFGELSKVRL